jgi:hypothetical protein
MPITFDCDCGKQFTVADEFAGKRTKCPACKSALTVPETTPTPPAAEEEALSDEDKAFRALAEAPDPEPTAAPARASYAPSSFERAPPKPPQSAPPGPAKVLKSPKTTTNWKDSPRRESRRHDPDAIKRILYVIGGVLMMLIGGVVGFFSIDRGISIRGGVFGFFLLIGGISTFFQGVSGKFDEE